MQNGVYAVCLLLWSFCDVQDGIADEAQLLAFYRGDRRRAACCYQDVLGLQSQHACRFQVVLGLQSVNMPDAIIVVATMLHLDCSCNVPSAVRIFLDYSNNMLAATDAYLICICNAGGHHRSKGRKMGPNQLEPYQQ